jgi:hypothetical protein
LTLKRCADSPFADRSLPIVPSDMPSLFCMANALMMLGPEKCCRFVPIDIADTVAVQPGK